MAVEKAELRDLVHAIQEALRPYVREQVELAVASRLNRVLNSATEDSLYKKIRHAVDSEVRRYVNVSIKIGEPSEPKSRQVDALLGRVLADPDPIPTSDGLSTVPSEGESC